MPTVDATIDDLRRQIDEIDRSLHDLLMRRCDVAAQIGALKNDGGSRPAGGFFRPAREAAVLRRLVERHHGALPKATVVRMWREIMAALLRLQGPFAVAVLAPANRPVLWDVARDHFGSLTPATAQDTIGQVLRAVIDGEATVGVLPLPQEDDREPWWPQLLSSDASQPRVLARLPFGAGGASRGGAAEALVIGRVAQEETGRDRSLCVDESVSEMSRSALGAALKAAALAPVLIHQRRDPNDAAAWFHLVEVEGCLLPDDARLGKLAGRKGGIRQVWPLGGYAVPFSAAELT